MNTPGNAIKARAPCPGNPERSRVAIFRNGSPRPRSNLLRALAAAALFSPLVFHGSAMAQSAQFPLVDGKPAFLMPDFALDEHLPDLGTAGATRVPETSTENAVPLRPQITWRAIAPSDDIFLERAPGELQ